MCTCRHALYTCIHACMQMNEKGRRGQGIKGPIERNLKSEQHFGLPPDKAQERVVQTRFVLLMFCTPLPCVLSVGSPKCCQLFKFISMGSLLPNPVLGACLPSSSLLHSSVYMQTCIVDIHTCMYTDEHEKGRRGQASPEKGWEAKCPLKQL